MDKICYKFFEFYIVIIGKQYIIKKDNYILIYDERSGTK
jgi:hypothetical protein